LSRTFSLFFLRFSPEFAILLTNEVMILKTKFWIAILALTVLLCLGLTLLTMGGEEASRAKITSDGKLLRIVDLAIDQEFTVETTDGYNVVTVRDGKIAVTEASCPDHYCMARGFCNNGAQIVCLPNRLVIEFLGEAEIDGIVG
jgi:hypothetical protein